MVEDQPEFRTGKLCYVEIPAVDVARSAEFYQQAFGWQFRRRGDGATSFDDTVGQVSGTFVSGRPPAAEPGFLIYIMVADAQAAMDAVVRAAAGSCGHRTRPRVRCSPGSPTPAATSWASTSSWAWPSWRRRPVGMAEDDVNLGQMLDLATPWCLRAAASRP